MAQRLASQAGKNVLFVATAQASDAEMAERIQKHQALRPAHWRTVEEPFDIVQAIEREGRDTDVVLVDCLTLWVSNLLFRYEGDPSAEARILGQAANLLDLWERQDKPWFVVSNEVGMGLVPPYPLGRTYRDILGRVNQLIAARADKVLLLVAGLAVDLKAKGAASLDEF